MDTTSLIYALVGGLLCLFGFALYWGGLKVVGMFLGGSIAVLIGIIVAYVTRIEPPTLVLAIVALLGLIGMAVGWRLLKGAHGFLVFLVGAGLGYLFVKFVLASYDRGGVWDQPWMVAIGVVVGGLLSLLLFRYVITLVTSAAGAYLLFLAFGRQLWILIVAFLIGLLVQIGLFHRFGLHRKVRTRWS